MQILDTEFQRPVAYRLFINKNKNLSVKSFSLLNAAKEMDKILSKNNQCLDIGDTITDTSTNFEYKVLIIGFEKISNGKTNIGGDN